MEAKAVKIILSKQVGPRLTHPSCIRSYRQNLPKSYGDRKSTVDAYAAVVVLAIVIAYNLRCALLHILYGTSHVTTQCIALLQEIRATPNNKPEASLPKLSRHPRWIPPNGYRGHLSLREGSSTLNTLQPARAGSKKPPASHSSPLANRTFANASRMLLATKN